MSNEKELLKIVLRALGTKYQLRGDIFDFVSIDDFKKYLATTVGQSHLDLYINDCLDEACLNHAADALFNQLTPEQQVKIKSFAPKPIIETNPITVTTNEFDQQLIDFLKAHPYDDFTCYQIAKELNMLEQKQTSRIFAVLKKLSASKSDKNTKKILLTQTEKYINKKSGKTENKTLYKYCPELPMYNKSRLNGMYKIIRRILTDFPQINNRQIRDKVKAYLITVDNKIIDDALYLLNYTESINITIGKRGAKNFSLNPNIDKTLFNAKLDKLRQTERFKKYKKS